MSFIPSQSRFNVGDRVRLNGKLSVFAGEYTAGHEFTVINVGGQRGIDLQGDDGRRVLECGMVHHLFEKV